MAEQEPYALNVGPNGTQVIDTSNGGAIAPDGNPMYVDYLEWIAAGNTPIVVTDPPEA